MRNSGGNRPRAAEETDSTKTRPMPTARGRTSAQRIPDQAQAFAALPEPRHLLQWPAGAEIVRATPSKRIPHPRLPHDSKRLAAVPPQPAGVGVLPSAAIPTTQSPDASTDNASESAATLSASVKSNSDSDTPLPAPLLRGACAPRLPPCVLR